MRIKADRKLGAVMFTDVVDFTKLMSEDEARALKTLQEKNSIVQSQVAHYSGQYIKSIGDGSLSFFDSAKEAVDCAISIQNSLKSEIIVRIGVHLGEIVHKDGDIFGDSVNIANRIEKISKPGGICISGLIFDQLENKKGYQFKHLGLHSFKGVGRLLDIYGLEMSEKEIIPHDSFDIIGLDSSKDLPSLSIIPFRNKGKEEDDFYSYSLSLDIFSKISSSSNIILSSMEEVEALTPRNSSKDILKALKIRYSLTGSLWKKDNMFNLSIELYDSNKDKMVWANSWLENWSNLPNIEKKISHNVIRILDSHSAENNVNQNYKISNIDSEAYRIYLKGKYVYHNRESEKDIIKSESFFKRSIDLDANLIQPRMLLGEIYFNRSQYDKSLEIYNNNLDMSIKSKDEKNTAKSLSSIANVNFVKGEYDKSLEYNLQALKIQKSLNSKKGIAQAFNSIGAVHDVLREHDKALVYYSDSLKLAKEINDKSGMARASLNISNLYNTTGQLNKALSMQKECIEMCKQSNNYPLLAYSYNLLGVIYSNLHKYDDSIKNLKKCLKLKKELNEPEGVASALKSIGVIYYYKGQYNQAMIYHKKSLKQRKEIGYKPGIGESLSYIADTYYKMGQYDKAISFYEESLEIMEFIKDYAMVSKILNRLGKIYRKMGQYEKALSGLKRSQDIKADINDFEYIGYTFLELSYVYQWKGEYDLAVKYNLKSMDVAKKYKMQKLISENLYHESLMLISRGNYSKAKSVINKAISIAKEKKYLNNAAKYLDCLGIILRHEKKFDKAIEVVDEALEITKITGNKHGLRKYSNSVGLIKERIGDFKGALKIYNECLKLSKEMGEKRSVAVSYNNIAGMLSVLGDFEDAIKYHKKAFSYAKRINYIEGQAGFAYNIASILLKQKKYVQSIKYIEMSINAFESTGNPYVKECYIFKAYIYVNQNNFDKVKHYFKYFKDVNPENNYGHIRNWELYSVNLFLGDSKKIFLDNAYRRMQDDLKSIKNKISKKLFLNHFTYGELINEEFQKGGQK